MRAHDTRSTGVRMGANDNLIQQRQNHAQAGTRKWGAKTPAATLRERTPGRASPVAAGGSCCPGTRASARVEDFVQLGREGFRLAGPLRVAADKSTVVAGEDGRFPP